MVALNTTLPSGRIQAEYDCQTCGAAETQAMKKRVQDFCRPACDDCRAMLPHQFHVPNRPVVIGETHISMKIDPEDGKLKRTETRREKTIRYGDWDGRCRECLP